ncbi:MAG: cysteine hydrolase [Deltaproteobacteria bacterium]|nr:cysteine hydrolase [Deltaproteobacteria bacterium]
MKDSNNIKTPDVIYGKAALLVIDFQNDFILSGAPIECPGGQEAVKNTLPLIEKARSKKIPVIFTTEFHRDPKVFGPYDFGRELDGEDPVHCVKDSDGYQLVDELLPLAPTDYVLDKPRYSTFIGTDLDLILRSHKTETLIITGVCTNICVHYNFIDAHQRDYRVRVVEECVAGTSLDAHNAALKQINYLQYGGVQKLSSIMTAIDQIEDHFN